MSQSTRGPDEARASIPIEDAVEQVIAEVRRRGVLTEQSLDKITDISRRFARFGSFRRGRVLGAVTPKVAARFVNAPRDEGEPAVATMHLRRSVIRLVFRVGRELGLAEGDPTLDLKLPPRSSLKLRPLSDDEVALGRSYSLETLSSTRPSAAWALAEATATTSEIHNVRVGDLRLDEGRVWIGGSRKTDPRWGQVDPWGLRQLERRLRALPDTDANRPVVYEGKGSAQSRQASSCQAISHTLVRAGLGGEPDVRPASVTAWAGLRMYDYGLLPIEEIAIRLGKRSLDRTADFLGIDWR